jgi:stearoyl-CoA desaturase (Delta-9 desaturase)
VTTWVDKATYSMTDDIPFESKGWLARSRSVFALFHLSIVSYCFGAVADPVGILLVWFIIQMGVHAGYHRYFTHRSFRTFPWCELVLGLAGCLAYQHGPIWWASKHRRHHQYADTEQDHHTPIKSFWHAHIGWLWAEGAGNIEWRYVSDLRRPIPLWIEAHERWIHATYVSAAFLVGGWSGVLNWWAVPIVICWHTTFSTNSICHVLGSRPRSCHPPGACNARNNALVAILNLGEGWHNNHHANPSLSHHGCYRWYEIDIVYAVLLVLERLGLVWDLKRRRKTPRQNPVDIA